MSHFLPIRRASVCAAALLLAGSAALGHVPTIRAAGPALTFGPESVIYANGSTGNQMRQHCYAGGTCLNIWPDTPLSAVPDGSGYDWYAASSGLTAKTTGPLDDPAQTVDYAARPVTGTLPYLAVRTVTVGDQPATSSSSSGFTSTQGQNGWSYQGSTDGERSYRNMSWDAADQRWQGSEFYCIAAAGWQHPGVGCDSVRVWTAPSGGDLAIGANGPIAVAASCGGNTAGVDVRILKNGAQIWPASGSMNVGNGTSTPFPGLTTSVAPYDQVQFVVAHAGPVNYCDTTSWDQTVAFQPGLHRASSGFTDAGAR